MDFLSPEESSLLEFLHSGKRILIITGEVNSGKTTTVERVIALLTKNGISVGGFYSKGIFDGDKKVGFNIVDIKSGELTQFASITANEKYLLKQGRYFFNPVVFDECNVKIKNSFESEVIIIDEIGPIELKEMGFYLIVSSLITNFGGKLIFVIRESEVLKVINLFSINAEDIFLLKPKSLTKS